MIKLLNSAMMPAPGIYKAESIAKDEFVHLVQQAHAFQFLIGKVKTELSCPKIYTKMQIYNTT